MENNIELDVLDGEKAEIPSILGDGTMVVARSKGTYMYILDRDRQYQLFMHTPGSPEGGQKQLAKDEKNSAIVNNLAKMADALFTAKFDPEMDVFKVMASAEDAIDACFPCSDGEDEDIDFIIPSRG